MLSARLFPLKFVYARVFAFFSIFLFHHHQPTLKFPVYFLFHSNLFYAYKQILCFAHFCQTFCWQVLRLVLQTKTKKRSTRAKHLALARAAEQVSEIAEQRKQFENRR